MTTTETGRRRLLRVGAVMAAGTFASRITGFIRTAVLASAIGTTLLGDAYNVAYTIPFILFDLLIGGVLSSVVVPLLVRARKRDSDGGVAYEQRLLTLVTVVLIGVATLGVILAGPIIDLYAHDMPARQHDVTVTLTRFILPQVAFFGVGALAGAMLNVRERFAAPMWAPVLNNLVVIGVGLTYLVVSNAGRDITKVTAGDLRLLGLGTTAGIVLQAMALWLALRRAGFRWRPRLGLRDARLREMGRMAVWTLVYVVITQIGFVVITNLSTAAQAKSTVSYGVGFTPYNLAFQLFQLPYAIIAVSVITALLPRMSGHAAEGRLGDLREDFSSGLRMAMALIVPAALLLVVLGPAVAVLLFAHGNNPVADAVYVGNVLQVFALALVPFSIFQLQLRVFYALGDTRTPAFIGLLNLAVNASLGYTAFLVLPAERVVMGLGFAFAMAYVTGTAVAWLVLSRRLGGLDGTTVARTLVRLHLAALPAMVMAGLFAAAISTVFGLTDVSAAIILVAATVVGGLAFLMAAGRLGVTEVRSILSMVLGRLRPRSETPEENSR